MDTNTKVLVSLIRQTTIDDRPDLYQQSKIAFIDYLASALMAKDEAKVRAVASLVGKRQGHTPLLGQDVRSTPENAAFFNGFCSHYLDFDDAQANIAGHFSTVLFSALLAVATAETTVRDFLTAYVIGAEVEGLFGSVVNPAHKLQGWHSTGTIGPIGAAAAIAKLARLDERQTAQLLSLGATQSCGMGFEAGSDAKPMHAGFAARNAVFAYYLVTEAGLSAMTNPFNNDTGWFPTIANLTLPIDEVKAKWLNPGQIIAPGLWMKIHPYCSAGICGAAGCSELYQKGYRLDTLQDVTFHFPPGADTALRYSAPTTGQEGRFSMEYVAWQILTTGAVRDDYFKLPVVSEAFTTALPKFKRVNDIEKVEKSVRLTKVTATTAEGKTVMADVREPLGSPAHPFTETDLEEKLRQATSPAKAKTILQALASWPHGTLASIVREI